MAAQVEARESVRVRRLVLAVDVGRVVNRDGVRNQIEGGAIQAASWTLKEQVRFGPDGVTSLSWETYPVLRFSEIPQVDVIVIDRPGHPSVGAGECAAGPVAGAIANGAVRRHRGAGSHAAADRSRTCCRRSAKTLGQHRRAEHSDGEPQAQIPPFSARSIQVYSLLQLSMEEHLA